MLTDTRPAVARLQRFSDAHNPAFPGYRRTLQPMQQKRRRFYRDPVWWVALFALLVLGAVAWIVGSNI